MISIAVFVWEDSKAIEINNTSEMLKTEAFAGLRQNQYAHLLNSKDAVMLWRLVVKA